MSIKVAKYTFGSWMRKGIGGRITTTDNLGSGATSNTLRSTVNIEVKINDHLESKNFELLSPGDIIGVNPAMIVRTEPLNWITNFEPNYLPFIEFYDEDFLWRYTPAQANGDKLRPWLALIVLKDEQPAGNEEFTFNEKKLPLPSVIVKHGNNLPPSNQIWAWSHVHINEGHDSTTEFEAFLKTLNDLDNENSDKIIGRLLCPRKLDSNTAYRAFLIPAFETGRLSGLGLENETVDAQKPSWNASSNNIEFPVYYHWFFKTGDNQDFESLVKILEPRIMDSKLGIRDMDGSKPGFGLTEGTDIGITEALNVVGLEGALKAPTTVSEPKVLDTTKPFFNQLEDVLNFPEKIKKASNTETDPVVSPPIYGQNHALTNEIDTQKAGWLHELNKDPRNRVPAGFGTNVVQKDQEKYVAEAWKQVENVKKANIRIKFAAFAMQVSQTLKTNFTSKLQPAQSLIFLSPLLKKVKGSPTTLQYQLEESFVPTAAVNTALRKILRPRGPFFKKIAIVNPNFNHSTLVNDINDGKITAAPPKIIPVGLPRIDEKLNNMPGKTQHPLLSWILQNLLLFLILILVAILIFGLITGAWYFCLVAAIIAIAYYFKAKNSKATNINPKDLNNPEEIVKNLEQSPPQPDFVFQETNPLIIETNSGNTKVSSETKETVSGEDGLAYTFTNTFTPGANGKDSVEAANFRAAAIHLNQLESIKTPERKFSRFDIGNAHLKLQEATDPRKVFPKMLASFVIYTFNKNWLFNFDNLVPAMAYPDMPEPMYEKLRDISSELLIPNLKLIPQNTISLLVTNPEFIESYMVGLNHEFGKELLWREYPTDKRGSYFRQFWDVKGIISNNNNLDPNQLKEEYKDIQPIDKWYSNSALGTHPKRKAPDGEQVVLVVRGELLKKYPNTIIYAQKAHIFKDENGVINANKQPVIKAVETQAEMAAEIKFPMFKAEINPDIKFFGFDLTVPQAMGKDEPKLETDDWGWYFIIQQIPGEPRFGMDVNFEKSGTQVTWDDLRWDKYTPTDGFINTDVKPNGDFKPAAPENVDDWGQNSARMGHILYQKPVMIAVHAKEMLKSI
ncbi:hypothetical protein [Pedobacter sp. Leaf170]|uniref:hypothetical protein n=1 Tax=Pedobacter sp. Leaf170 TaxID=2876558 RepID=UPI001E4BC9EB|nr:hypothetical protein [Pedobacter sp. Leaf170]